MSPLLGIKWGDTDDKCQRRRWRRAWRSQGDYPLLSVSVARALAQAAVASYPDSYISFLSGFCESTPLPWVHSIHSRGFLWPPEISVWPLAFQPRNSFMVSHCSRLHYQFLYVVYRALCDQRWAEGRSAKRWRGIPVTGMRGRTGKDGMERCSGSKNHLGSCPGRTIGLCHLSLSFPNHPVMAQMMSKGAFSCRALSWCSRYVSWLALCPCPYLSVCPSYSTDTFAEKFLSADMSHRL